MKLKSIFKRLSLLFFIIAAMTPLLFTNSFALPANATSKTGVDMANWALNAYYDGWEYSYGSAVPGAVDCSGLIASFGVGGSRCDMMGSSPNTGDISSLPEIAGLGLYMPGHVGVYIGDGMAVDARDYGLDVCYDSVSNMPWTDWFEISGIDYGENVANYTTPTASSPFNLIALTGIDKLFASVGCQTGVLNTDNQGLNLNTILILCLVSLISIGAILIMITRFKSVFRRNFSRLFYKFIK